MKLFALLILSVLFFQESLGLECDGFVATPRRKILNFGQDLSFRTSQLEVRLPREDEILQIIEIAENPRVLEMLGDYSRDSFFNINATGAQSWVKMRRQIWSPLAQANSATLVVVFNGRVVGFLQWYQVSRAIGSRLKRDKIFKSRDRLLTWVYGIHPLYWHRGLGGELLEGHLKYAFEHFHINGMVSHVLSKNTSSLRLVERMGFEHRFDYFTQQGRVKIGTLNKKTYEDVSSFSTASK